MNIHTEQKSDAQSLKTGLEKENHMTVKGSVIGQVSSDFAVAVCRLLAKEEA